MARAAEPRRRLLRTKSSLVLAARGEAADGAVVVADIVLRDRPLRLAGALADAAADRRGDGGEAEEMDDAAQSRHPSIQNPLTADFFTSYLSVHSTERSSRLNSS